MKYGKAHVQRETKSISDYRLPDWLLQRTGEGQVCAKEEEQKSREFSRMFRNLT